MKRRKSTKAIHFSPEEKTNKRVKPQLQTAYQWEVLIADLDGVFFLWS